MTPAQRAHYRLTVLAILGSLAALPAHATTIVPLSDESLVDRATIVAAVTVEAKLAVVGDRPVTHWQVVIDRALKGAIDTGRIVLRVPGGERADGMALYIYGTPKLREGGKALVFLQPREDGTYALADFPQGAFLAARSSRRTLALRDFSEVKIVDAGRVGSREPMRDFDRFADWIEDRASGYQRTPDYVVQPRRSELDSIVSPFTLLDDSGTNFRWFEFDSGGSVTWFSHSTPMPGLSGGGANEFKKGLAVWNNESTTPVRYVYAGTSAASGGLDTFDFLNVVTWTDLNNEIAGTFDCSGGGGTLAVGGPWYDADTRGSFNGKTFIRIQGADIVFNDGLACRAGSSDFSKFIEEVAGHETGHTLGIGHSSETRNESNSTLKNALMFAFVHDDGRGAKLNSDDVAALQALYKKGGSGGGGRPKPPASGCPAGTAPDTLCLLKGRFHVTGTWQNQFDGSSGVVKPIVNSDLAGFFYFTDPRNIELIIKILDFQTEFKVFYSQLTNIRFTLTVRDTTTGRTKTYSNTAGECGAIDQNFAAGASISSVSAPLSTVSAAATGTCSPSSGTLCTLDRRFAITVDWRNQFNGASGTGLAKSLSDLTGAFAFDDPANLEILIKTLQFPDKILVLYGSLSNFEYTLHVRDTLTGQTKDYRNAAGNFCGGLDDKAF